MIKFWDGKKWTVIFHNGDKREEVVDRELMNAVNLAQRIIDKQVNYMVQRVAS